MRRTQAKRQQAEWALKRIVMRMCVRVVHKRAERTEAHSHRS